MRTYQQIKNSVLKMGYTWSTRPNELNFVWERVDFEATNKFTDFLYVCYLNSAGIESLITLTATTKPGLKGSLMQPTTVEGVTGTAVIETPQEVKDGWSFVDKYDGFSKYPYFQQVAPVNYWRDGNKDTHIDKVNEQLHKVFGTNWHRMSQTGTYGSGTVDNWSLGCCGCPEPEFIKILEPVRTHVKLYGSKFTGKFLNKENFIQ